MRGMETGKTRIRHEVFTEIARMAYEGGDYAQRLEELPYKICPGDPDEIGPFRNNLLIERAVVGERLRLAMGLPMRKLGVHNNISDRVEETVIAEKYYEPPLINVIKFACNRCPDNIIKVTNGCQGCIEHPCIEICPKKAISKVNGHAHIDADKCVRCGRCMDACSFSAIIRQERPCKKACGIAAIGKDELGRAAIDYKKCTSCGQCLVNCPFGAISDKSQIFQTIMAIKSGVPVYVVLAPAFVGQFGPDAPPAKIVAAIKKLGISAVRDVSIGADLCTIEEAHDFLDKVPEQQPFMATSCCPSWSVMAKKLFPQFAPYISMALTPMVITARMIKKEHPNAKVVFVGPCAAKKLEASRRSVRSDVDFVLTFEELQGMFDAKEINFKEIEPDTDPVFDTATGAGRGFAVSGGVAGAVAHAISELAPDRELLVDYADGLRECRKMLMLAKAGKRNGYLLEGMGCPGGCVAGAGTIQPAFKGASNVSRFQQEAKEQNSLRSPLADRLHDVEE